jgi:quinol monooxygenase YgiN
MRYRFGSIPTVNRKTMPEIAVVSINTARAGQEAKLEAAMRALIEPTRKDPGFIQYDLHRDVDDPRTFVFVERWESRELLDAHLRTPHLLAFRAAAPELIENKVLRFIEKIG